jgi:Tfp pilus assembly protein PilN
MINLLPPNTKKELRSAHTNAILVKYMTFTVIAIVMMAAAYGVSYMILRDSRETASLQIENYDAAEKDLTAIESNILMAKDILDREIRYSDVITELAALIPKNVVLDKLVVDRDSVSSPITLQLNAKSKNDLTSVQGNFLSSKIFTNFSIAPETTKSESSEYPVAIKITVTIKKGGSV